MSGPAYVRSIDALVELRAAMAAFRDEAGQALADVRAELQRFDEWLEHDQLRYWKHQIRAREDQVVEAKLNLSRCLAATLDPERTPSCHDEKKQVAAAKRRLAEAEEKLLAVRRWIRDVRQAAIDYQARVEPLGGALEVDVPRAMGQLDRLVLRLEEYLSTSVPATAQSESFPARSSEASRSGTPADSEVRPAGSAFETDDRTSDDEAGTSDG